MNPKLRKLIAAWGGVTKLSMALNIHRSTLYRYMGGELEVPKHAKISCNFFAERVGVPPPFEEEPLDEDIRKFLTKHLRRSA